MPVPQDFLNASWRWLVVRGVLAIVFGIVAMAWPLSTVIAFALLWGLWALVDGIGLAAAALDGGPTGQRVLLAVMAAIAFLAALLAIFRPALTAAALIWVLGIWLIVRGAFELVGALSATQLTPRWVLVLGGLLDLLLGVLFVANPGQGAVGIALLLGLIALAWGLLFVFLGLFVRSQAKQLETSGAP